MRELREETQCVLSVFPQEPGRSNTSVPSSELSRTIRKIKTGKVVLKKKSDLDDPDQKYQCRQQRPPNSESHSQRKFWVLGMLATPPLAHLGSPQRESEHEFNL